MSFHACAAVLGAAELRRPVICGYEFTGLLRDANSRSFTPPKKAAGLRDDYSWAVWLKQLPRSQQQMIIVVRE
jgi:hypothetical protein